jgi:hypothetical protein
MVGGGGSIRTDRDYDTPQDYLQRARTSVTLDLICPARAPRSTISAAFENDGERFYKFPMPKTRNQMDILNCRSLGD